MGTRTKAALIGSSQWIQNERDQAQGFVDEAAEDFSFAVRNDLDWLNAHMADIFSKNQT